MAKVVAAKKTVAKKAAPPPAPVVPAFTHIHCSSRYDRPAAQLANDVDDWIKQCSILTVTEVTNDQRARALQEKGWNYYNANIGTDSDNCAIAWELATWKRQFAVVQRLSNDTFARYSGTSGLYIYSCTVVLKHAVSGHKLLVSVSHFPSHVEGVGGFTTVPAQWQGRKMAYLSSLTNWSTHVLDLERKHGADASLIIADWNLNLKDKWVLNLLDDHWPKGYHLAWQNFPTSGGGLSGGPTAPKGAPGAGTGDRIIDGTLYRALKVINAPDLMPRVNSSDHRPYKEGFRFKTPNEIAHPDPDDPDSPTGDGVNHEGDMKAGEEWWGFGDYMDDEIYSLELATGTVGGEVL